MVLAMGTSLATGVVLGLLSCKQDAPVAPLPKTDPIPGTLTSEPMPPSTSSPASTPSATSQSTSTQDQTSQPDTAATQTQAAGKPAPDMGAELFPDAQGRAIAQASDAPVIIVPRADWTRAGPNLAQIALMNGINRITVHHTAGQILTDAWQPTAGELESIREFHAGTRPSDRAWADIAYHFAVDRAGRVWQARPLAYQGAHVHSHNEHNLGIVLMGNFEIQSPSAAQLTSLASFIGFLRKIYAIDLNNVFTHGELGDTSCPGKLLQDYMDRSRLSWASAEGIRWNKLTTKPAPDAASAPSPKN
jgi:hypothetical protein